MAEDRLVKIASMGSRTEAEQFIQILKENGVAAYRKGGIMDVYAGDSITGEDVIISEKDQETARKLLEEFVPIKVGFDSPERSQKQSMTNKILLGIIVLMLIFGIAIACGIL